MKNTIKLLALTTGLILTVFFISGCANTSADISKNPALKEKVFQQIMNNEDLFNDFMNSMMSNHQSMDWMMSNQNMMKSMYSDSSLNYIMQHNGNMSYSMMENMMKVIGNDTALRNQWQNMMKNNSNMPQMMMHH